MNIQQVLDKLPEVRGWIEDKLNEHKARTRPVASYGFTRLPQYYSAETLASTFVIEVPEVPVPPLADFGLTEFTEFQNGKYRGITFLNSYFVQESDRLDESLHFHELVHVIQWQHLGPSGFLAAYAAGYLAAGNYRDNPLEVMAYALQDYFDQNQPPKNVEPFIRRQIDEHVTPLLECVMKEQP